MFPRSIEFGASLSRAIMLAEMRYNANSYKLCCRNIMLVGVVKCLDMLVDMMSWHSLSEPGRGHGLNASNLGLR